MNGVKTFERVRDHARKVERMYLVTVMVDEAREEVSIGATGGERPATLDMRNMGGVLGRACNVEIENSDDAISLIDGVMNGATEELTFDPRGTLIRSKFLFSDGTRIVWGRILFTRGRGRTEVIDYPPYVRRSI